MVYRRIVNDVTRNAVVTISRLKVPIVDVLPVLTVGGQFMGVTTATGVDLWYYDGDNWYKIVDSSGGGGNVGLPDVLATNNNSGGINNIILDNNGGAGVGALTSESGDDLNLFAGAVNTSSPSAGSESLRLASGTAGLINIDAGTLGFDVDSVGTFMLDVTAGGISLDAAGVSNFTTTTGDLMVNSTTGSVNIFAGEAVADAINIDAAIGGIDIDCDTGFTLDVASGSMSLDAAGISNMTAAGDLTVNSTTGKLILTAADAGVDAIDMDASSGGIDMDCDSSFTVDVASGGISMDATTACNLSTTTGDLTISSTAGSVILTSDEATSDAIQLLPTAATGKVQVGSAAGDSTELLVPDGTISITQTSTDSSVSDTTVWQSFTSTIAGRIRRVSVFKASADTDTTTFDIKTGTGTGGTSILPSGAFSFTFPDVPAGTQVDIYMPEVAPIDGSSVYSFIFTGGATVDLQLDTGNPYAGGRASTSATDDLRFIIEQTRPTISFISDDRTGLFLNDSDNPAFGDEVEEVASFVSGTTGMRIGSAGTTTAHMTALQDTEPTIVLSGGATNTPTVVGTLTDMAGTISFPVSAAGAATMVVTFNQAFPTLPHVVAVPVDPGSGNVITDLHVSAVSTTDFDLSFTTVGAPASLNALSFHVFG